MAELALHLLYDAAQVWGTVYWHLKERFKRKKGKKKKKRKGIKICIKMQTVFPKLLYCQHLTQQEV